MSLFYIDIIIPYQCINVHCGERKDLCIELACLTHWGRVTHICVNKLTIIGWDNGLSPGRRQAIIWTNAGILLIRTLGTNFSEILGEIHSFSFSKRHLKMSSAKWRLFGLGLDELKMKISYFSNVHCGEKTVMIIYICNAMYWQVGIFLSNWLLV